MPKSISPADEKALVTLSKPQEPFNDKDLVKAAVTQKWAPVPGQKCWEWNRVEYRRTKGSTPLAALRVTCPHGSHRR